MRQNTELTAIPPKFTVTIENDKAIIAFFMDVQECKRQEQEQEITYYVATCWTMTVKAQDNLEARIAAHPDLWLAKVKAVTEVEEADARLEELKKTATDDAVCDLAEIVADLINAVTELGELIATMGV